MRQILGQVCTLLYLYACRFVHMLVPNFPDVEAHLPSLHYQGDPVQNRRLYSVRGRCWMTKGRASIGTGNKQSTRAGEGEERQSGQADSHRNLSEFRGVGNPGNHGYYIS